MKFKLSRKRKKKPDIGLPEEGETFSITKGNILWENGAGFIFPWVGFVEKRWEVADLIGRGVNGEGKHVGCSLGDSDPKEKLRVTKIRQAEVQFL